MKKACILCIALALMCSCAKREKKVVDTRIPVDVMVVGNGNDQVTRTYVGTVESETLLSLYFPAGGTLVEKYVNNGSFVKKGQLIARVNNVTIESMYESAAATYRQAQDGYKRLKSVHAGGGISDVRWVQMETDLTKAEQAYLSAKESKEKCSLYATIDGFVAGADEAIGYEYKPMEPFGQLMDLNALRVYFSVPEQEIGLVQTGTVATAIIPALDNKEVSLTITDRCFMANPLGHTYEIKAVMPQGALYGDLLPGMVAKISTNVTGKKGIVVPSNAVITMSDGLAIWKIVNGKAHRQYITTADYVENGVLLQSGLVSGDTIVAVGFQKLYEGANVIINE